MCVQCFYTKLLITITLNYRRMLGYRIDNKTNNNNTIIFLF